MYLHAVGARQASGLRGSDTEIRRRNTGVDRERYVHFVYAVEVHTRAAQCPPILGTRDALSDTLCIELQV